MLNWIKNLFRKRNRLDKINFDIEDKRLHEKSKFIWCLIGNIVENYPFGVNNQIQNGTKHFSPKSKVYCLPGQWGDGYENIKVIGRHRNTNRYVCITMQSKLITNWRLQKVYRPYILNVMQSQLGWTDSDNDKDTILKMLKWLPNRTIKIED